MSKSESWEPCPRCGSTRVQQISKGMIALVFFVTAGIAIWVGLLIPPAWIAVPILLILAIAALFGKNTLQCQDCKKQWTYNTAKENTAKQTE